MHLTQDQLGLIAQIAPVFLLVIVVERRDLGRMIRFAERKTSELDQRTIRAPRWWRWVMRSNYRIVRWAPAGYTLILGLLTFLAVDGAGHAEGLSGHEGRSVWLLFLLGVSVVLLLAILLIVEAIWPASDDDD